MQLATTETIPALTATLAAALTEQCRLDISSDGNTLVIPADVGDGALTHLIARLGAMQSGTEQLDAVLRYNLGRAVMQLAACGPEKRDIESVIDEADLPSILGRSGRTIANWAYVARVIPPEDLPKKPVSWTILSEAAAAPPKDLSKMPEFRKDRSELLEEAANSPETCTAKKMREKVKELQAKFNPPTGERVVRESTQELMLRFVKLSRLARVAHSGQLQEVGIESHGVLVDLIENLDNELVNREICQPDPLAESFYWLKKPQETEEQ
jgi:hypothetical protein